MSDAEGRETDLSPWHLAKSPNLSPEKKSEVRQKVRRVRQNSTDSIPKFAVGHTTCVGWEHGDQV